MNLFANLFSSLRPEVDDTEKSRQTQRAIDASMRLPLLGVIKASVFWLVVSIVLGTVSAIKLHSPSFLGGCAWLSYGMVTPAFWNALVYGWAFNAGFAAAAWILARMGGAPNQQGPLLAVSSAAWNVAVVVGLYGIFNGDQLPFLWFEFPSYVTPFLLAAYLGMGAWALLAFRGRMYRSCFASQWWILAAVFAFAWILTIAMVMLETRPVQGAFQALVNAWYVDNLLHLFVLPLALACLYFAIPKALGTPVAGYRYSGIAFWSWIFFASGTGAGELVNGPIPVWVSSLGVIASFGILFPATTLSIQLLTSFFGRFTAIWDGISGRYFFAGALSFVAYCLLKAFGSLRSAVAVTQFSSFDEGLHLLALLGVGGTVFTGTTYLMLPRLLNKSLPSTGLVDVQFWLQCLGGVLIVVGLVLGGIQQGELYNQSTASVLSIQKASTAYQVVTTMGFVALLLAALAFLASFVWMLVSPRKEKEATGDLLPEAPDLEYKAS